MSEDAAPRGSFGQRLVYWAYRGLELALKPLPLPFCHRLGGFLGGGFRWLAPPYRRLVERNLRIAYDGDLSAAERAELAKRIFVRLGSNLVSSIKLSTMRPEQVAACLEVRGMDGVRAATADGSGLIYLISHMGAWEILALAGAITPRDDMPRASLYQALSNPYLDAHVRGRREQTGTRLFDRKAGFGAPTKHLREGGGLGVLVDQHAGDLGAWCPFFGRLASTSTLAPLLAKRAGVAMFPVAVETIAPGRWRMTIGGPLLPAADEPVDTLTARMNGEVERAVRASPADWFWVHNRWKTPDPKWLLTRYRRGVALPPGCRVGDLKPFRVVVRSPNPLGDACMAVPAVRAIKRGRPDCWLAVLCPENLTGFWATVDEVDRVLPRPRSASNREVGNSLLEEGPFDVAVLLPNSPRSALEARRAGIPRIVGYPARWRDRMVHQLVPPRDARAGPRPHHVNHYLRLAERIGADVSDIGSLAAPPRDPAVVEPLRIGVSAGAEYGPAKCWPTERYVAAAKRVAGARPGARFVLFGTAREEAIGAELEAGMGALCENRIGRTDLSGLMAELRACALLITNDTGTMHLAAHLGVPTVALFGSTEPAWTGPLGTGHRVLRHHVPCSPCFLRECPPEFGFRCMEAIAVEEVAGAVLELLGRP